MKWLKQYDGKYCALFIKDRSKYNVLVNKPFKKWVKVSKTMDNHATNTNAVADARAFLQSVKNPEGNIDVCIDTERAPNTQENRHIVRCCAESVLFCGRQCVALRGDKEDLSRLEIQEIFYFF